MLLKVSGAALLEAERSVLSARARRVWAQEQLSGLSKHVQFVHAKFVLFDPLSLQPVVLSGSSNLSTVHCLSGCCTASVGCCRHQSPATMRI